MEIDQPQLNAATGKCFGSTEIKIENYAIQEHKLQNECSSDSFADMDIDTPSANSLSETNPNPISTNNISKKVLRTWGRSCVVPSCRLKKRNDPNIRLFSFPKDPNKQKEWATLCNITFNNDRKYVICSKHFKPQFTGKQFLKKNARPTLFLNEVNKNQFNFVSTPLAQDLNTKNGNDMDRSNEATVAIQEKITKKEKDCPDILVKEEYNIQESHVIVQVNGDTEILTSSQKSQRKESDVNPIPKTRNKNQQKDSIKPSSLSFVDSNQQSMRNVFLQNNKSSDKLPITLNDQSAMSTNSNTGNSTLVTGHCSTNINNAKQKHPSIKTEIISNNQESLVQPIYNLPTETLQNSSNNSLEPSKTDKQPLKNYRKSGNTCCVCRLTKRIDSTIKLFKVPTDPAKRKLWAKFCNFDWRDARPKQVCSKHFNESSYGKSKKYLIKGAVPTLRLNNGLTIDKPDQLVSVSDIMKAKDERGIHYIKSKEPSNNKNDPLSSFSTPIIHINKNLFEKIGIHKNDPISINKIYHEVSSTNLYQCQLCSKASISRLYFDTHVCTKQELC